MGIEIERKFLVNKDKWNLVSKPKKDFYRQGYLYSDSNKTIRVRQTNDKGYITIKGSVIGLSRTEFEYEIPKAEAEELLNQFSISELIKVRYKILFKNKVWEVDEFLGDNLGLIVAEIELEHENEQFEMPDWIANEVTGINKYYNSILATFPFSKWKE
jgi:CYTH domain-containing protein